MSRPKDPNRYPRYFREAVEAMTADENAVVPWPCDDLKDAKATRLAVYSFKGACIQAGWDRATMYPWIGALSTRIVERDGRWWLELFNMDTGDKAQLRSDAARLNARKDEHEPTSTLPSSDDAA